MATQVVIKIRVLVPDKVSEYDVEDVVNDMINAGVEHLDKKRDWSKWVIGTAVATEANIGFPDILLPDLAQ